MILPAKEATIGTTWLDAQGKSFRSFGVTSQQAEDLGYVQLKYIPWSETYWRQMNIEISPEQIAALESLGYNPRDPKEEPSPSFVVA